MNLSNQPDLTIIDLDIKSAGPTVCRNFFGEDSDFVKNLSTINDKTQRSIYISTSLPSEILRCINIVLKLVIVGLIVELNNIIQSYSKSNIFILELKKDGITFCGDRKILNIINTLHDYVDISPFINFIVNSNFKFHYDTYTYYCRYSKTTVLVSDNNDIIRKGIFKYSPQMIEKLSKQLFVNGEIDKSITSNYVDEKFIYVILKSNCSDLINQYLVCSNTNKVLIDSGHYVTLTPSIWNEISGIAYLKYLFNPLVKLYFDF